MRVAIILPILSGPGIIESVDELRHVPGNRVHLASDYMALPDLSRRYTHLTAPNGPLAGFLDPEVSHYDLTLDIAPESGRSWELPVALAHWCLFQGHEIVVESPDIAIWATGALQSDGEILSESYHVAAKLASSAGRLEALRPERSILLLPYGQDAYKATISNTGEIFSVTSLDDAVGKLDFLKKRPPLSVTAPPDTTRLASRPKLWHVLAGLAILALLAGYAFLQSPPLPDLDAKQPARSVDASGKPAANPLVIEHYTSRTTYTATLYAVDLYNPGVSAVHDISLRIANKEGLGLLVQEGFIVPAGARKSVSFILYSVAPDVDSSAALICLSGRAGEDAAIHYRKTELSNGNITALSERFEAPYPVCDDLDFSWIRFPDRKSCEATQLLIGEIDRLDCRGLPEEAEPAYHLAK